MKKILHGSDYLRRTNLNPVNTVTGSRALRKIPVRPIDATISAYPATLRRNSASSSGGGATLATDGAYVRASSVGCRKTWSCRLRSFTR